MARYAVTDLHGQYELFLYGLEKIGFTDKDELFVLGDVIDKGPDSIKLMCYLMDHANMHFLLGNHELMMLGTIENAFRYGESRDLWLYDNYGYDTYREFKTLPAKKQDALLDYILASPASLLVRKEDQMLCLTHSFFNSLIFGKPVKKLSERELWPVVWCSPFREGETFVSLLEYVKAPYTFITGHVPVQYACRKYEPKFTGGEYHLEPVIRENLIDIDGGAAIGYRPELETGLIFLNLSDLNATPVTFREWFKSLPDPAEGEKA